MQQVQKQEQLSVEDHETAQIMMMKDQIEYNQKTIDDIEKVTKMQNELAKEIYSKADSHDDKLEYINKNLKNSKGYVKKALKEVKITEESREDKCMIC